MNIVEIKKNTNSKAFESFTHNGITFSQDNLTLIPGLCAVDNKENVEKVFQTLHSLNIQCARMGAYKPRTNPYTFQGLEKKCLPYVFELAGKYNIKIVCLEITKERHIEEVEEALEQTGHPTAVMLQIGTRNAQNFELLKSVGQTNHPILYKRGFGITLQESLMATEYIAKEGNKKIMFCLRGMKSEFGYPHRNFVDFAQTSYIKTITNLPICIDPSHSVGNRNKCLNGILDIFHTSSQGVIVGANAILLDCHPNKETALVDGAQALSLEELSWFVEDCQITFDAYQKRKELAKANSKKLSSELLSDMS